MTSYEVMTVVDKARKTGDELAYYEQDQLALFHRTINTIISELLTAKVEVKANATGNE